MPFLCSFALCLVTSKPNPSSLWLSPPALSPRKPTIVGISPPRSQSKSGRGQDEPWEETRPPGVCAPGQAKPLATGPADNESVLGF